MAGIEETKDWIVNTVWPEIVKNGKLKSAQNKNISSEEPPTLLNVSLTPIGIEEAFMLTTCHKIKIDYTCGNEERSLHLVAKRTPKEVSAESYEAVDFKTLFYNEITAYNKIFPKLLKLTNTDTKNYNCPTYYYSDVKEMEASIVLSDFKEDGFQMSPSRINLSLEHVLLGVELIGGFHGLCYALKAINKKEFDDLAALAKESRYAKSPPAEWGCLGPITMKRLSKATDKFYPEMPKDLQEKIKQLLNDCWTYSKERVKPIEPYATLCHGDYLRNNIAFSYDDKEKPTVPKKAMMFDFQTLRYSSPMVDLTTFLTISTGMDVRVPHFDKIFDTYHHKLSSSFVDFTKKELPEFMTRSNMLKEYVRYLPYSLGIAAFFLPNMHEPNNIFAKNMLGENFNLELIEAGLMALGGEAADKELASLQKELYEFTVQEDINIFEGFL
ncbi:uncharacterized protein LOC129939234 [Eupeodes corollae]|uniref:uncharacterized protein LOC129939234 n=1 Tax=Eupeodes corollae TaxID=290404 RepID=UPI00248F981D|nr:uncharacterized protein LOC129939234 [Eupeodes corollae]